MIHAQVMTHFMSHCICNNKCVFTVVLKGIKLQLKSFHRHKHHISKTYFKLIIITQFIGDFTRDLQLQVTSLQETISKLRF